MQITKILVPTDFSPEASAAIEPARTLAERFGARLELIHVYEVFPVGPDWTLQNPDGVRMPLPAFLRDAASRSMEKLLSELRARGMTVQGRVDEGAPWHVITELAARDHYDLIVVATHGRHGVQRALIGSVAEKIVRHAPCPVFVVHSPKKLRGDDFDTRNDTRTLPRRIGSY
jgi:nucleotide-binding universal stress UspA family protein